MLPPSFYVPSQRVKLRLNEMVPPVVGERRRLLLGQEL